LYSGDEEFEKTGTKKVRNQAFDNLLSNIRQELYSSPELNKEISGQ
jgi:hypothetical protein